MSDANALAAAVRLYRSLLHGDDSLTEDSVAVALIRTAYRRIVRVKAHAEEAKNAG